MFYVDKIKRKVSVDLLLDNFLAKSHVANKAAKMNNKKSSNMTSNGVQINTTTTAASYTTYASNTNITVKKNSKRSKATTNLIASFNSYYGASQMNQSV